MLDATILFNSSFLLILMSQNIHVELKQHVKLVDHAQLVLQPLILELYVELQIRQLELLLFQHQEHTLIMIIALKLN